MELAPAKTLAAAATTAVAAAKLKGKRTQQPSLRDSGNSIFSAEFEVVDETPHGNEIVQRDPITRRRRVIKRNYKVNGFKTMTDQLNKSGAPIMRGGFAMICPPVRLSGALWGLIEKIRSVSFSRSFLS